MDRLSWEGEVTASFSIIGLSVIFTGLTLGAVFALVAAGVTIVYGSIWMPNASSGQFFQIAALGTWSLCTWFGMHPALAATILLVSSIPLAYLFETTLIRRFYEAHDRNVTYFVITLGLTQIFSGLVSVTYGRISDQYSLPPLLEGLVFLGPFPLPYNRLLVLVIALTLLAALFLLLRLHPYGRALRAVFQNREAASLRGINVKLVYRFSLMLGMFVIFAGGILYAMAYGFDLTVAWTMAVTAFAIMIVGGPGSVLGAFVVGMIFGFTQALVNVIASPTVAAFAYLGVMLTVLLVKPEGVFSK
jgi:branched-chain amino acid transport system permease protein